MLILIMVTCSVVSKKKMEENIDIFYRNAYKTLLHYIYSTNRIYGNLQHTHTSKNQFICLIFVKTSISNIIQAPTRLINKINKSHLLFMGLHYFSIFVIQFLVVFSFCFQFSRSLPYTISVCIRKCLGSLCCLCLPSSSLQSLYTISTIYIYISFQSNICATPFCVENL